MSSKFELTMYQDTCYTSFFFVKSGSPLLCFHLNATRGVIPRFYNFKGERLRDDYIKLCQPRTYMAIQKRAWMSSFLFKKFLTFFNKLVPSGMSITNQHLLILDGNASHVTLEAIEHAQ
jgi:IS4 transposase